MHSHNRPMTLHGDGGSCVFSVTLPLHRCHQLTPGIAWMYPRNCLDLPQQWLKNVWALRGKGRVWCLGWGGERGTHRLSTLASPPPIMWNFVLEARHSNACLHMMKPCLRNCPCGSPPPLPISHFDSADLARIQFACHCDSAAVHCVD